MDELQAAVLRTGLPLLEGWNERRRSLVRAYDTLLEGRSEVRVWNRPDRDAQCRSACHLQVLRLGRRNALRRYLATRGVGTGVHYPLAHTQQRAFVQYGTRCRYPVAESLAREVLSIPLHPFLDETEVERTVGCLIEFWNTL
jgi:dTDP-4-amino-4,6-dideoxygalactose transaminase